MVRLRKSQLPFNGEMTERPGAELGTWEGLGHLSWEPKLLQAGAAPLLCVPWLHSLLLSPDPPVGQWATCSSPDFTAQQTVMSQAVLVSNGSLKLWSRPALI